MSARVKVREGYVSVMSGTPALTPVSYGASCQFAATAVAMNREKDGINAEHTCIEPYRHKVVNLKESMQPKMIQKTMQDDSHIISLELTPATVSLLTSSLRSFE